RNSGTTTMSLSTNTTSSPRAVAKAALRARAGPCRSVKPTSRTGIAEAAAASSTICPEPSVEASSATTTSTDTPCSNRGAAAVPKCSRHARMVPARLRTGTIIETECNRLAASPSTSPRPASGRTLLGSSRLPDATPHLVHSHPPEDFHHPVKLCHVCRPRLAAALLPVGRPVMQAPDAVPLLSRNHHGPAPLDELQALRSLVVDEPVVQIFTPREVVLRDHEQPVHGRHRQHSRPHGAERHEPVASPVQRAEQLLWAARPPVLPQLAITVQRVVPEPDTICRQLGGSDDPDHPDGRVRENLQRLAQQAAMQEKHVLVQINLVLGPAPAQHGVVAAGHP